MRLIDADALKQAILSIMPERSEVLLIIDNQPDAITLLKEKDRLHCEDCAYNGICETPHTDKSPLCAEYSIVR